ncbi:phospholipase [Nonomuraea aridisoli]|uniref:Phospholipase n=1 Tax=Nonomuraea aridisoli TaxID=2070368 RepID=A0A2W2EPP5_9ACTN|nr:phospholipase [Nonomuraea aridisoli]
MTACAPSTAAVASVASAVVESGHPSVAAVSSVRVVTMEQKLAALAVLTQPTTAGATTWRAAWERRASLTEFGFDWSSDLCSGAMDMPLTFDFRMPCRRHDFGYRNYRSVGRFAEHKARVDNAFLFDMRTVCARVKGVREATCRGIAWSYYQAVRRFGSLARNQDTARVPGV